MTEPAAVLLLVDDDMAKRYVLATWLKRAGHTVIEVGTGQEALDRATEAEVVLLDVNLPDMSGFDVCRALKSDPRTAAIPVIQVSATAVAIEDRAYGLTQGADAYLVEPTEPAELLPTVTAALRYYRARQQAEMTASRLTSLTSVTLNINKAQTFAGLARAAAAGAARIFEASAVLMLVLPDGQLRRMAASPDRPVPVSRGGRLDLADRVADRVLGPGEGHAAAAISQAEWLQLIPDSTLRTDVTVAVARTKPGRPPVAITVALGRSPGEEELQILRQLVQSTALAVEALRAYAEEHLVALTLQRSFLPAALPETPGIAICVRYAPASDQAEVGGDFYEALEWQDRLLVAIGDVQGHSLHAATVMGELRHALRAFVSEDRSPLEIAGLLNQVLRHYHPNILATLCLALLDPPSGRLDIVNCGHIPPLIVDDATAVYRGEGGLLLGMPVHKPHAAHAFLPPGGTMLMITDGLIEDRQVPIDDNMERLRAAAQEAAGADVEAFGNHMMSLFGAREDDVAIIAVRRSAL
ncbi:MAG TPA: SpoIIE family protein phosphatase [Streptosporangiaceae bacterium]|nr:SpoIIE family protein phosphatase [Streptosporangiaceae bacterium]